MTRNDGNDQKLSFLRLHPEVPALAVILIALLTFFTPRGDASVLTPAGPLLLGLQSVRAGDTDCPLATIHSRLNARASELTGRLLGQTVQVDTASGVDLCERPSLRGLRTQRFPQIERTAKTQRLQRLPQAPRGAGPGNSPRLRPLRVEII
jgi:hypothetical protein